MKIEIHRHNQLDAVNTTAVVSSTIQSLEKLDFELARNTASELREAVLATLMVEGWSDSVKVAGNTNITITSVRDRTGLCLQTGNMARFYADFLKLQLVYQNGHIDNALYCVFSKTTAVKMGSNLANFDRVVRELTLFRDIVTLPIHVLGMSAQ